MGYVGLRDALKPGEVPEKKTMSYDRILSSDGSRESLAGPEPRPALVLAVVTEDPDAAIHQQARALGATVVLIKPVDLARLGTALDLTPGDPRPIAPVTGSASLLPEVPPRPCAPEIHIVDDDALRRDSAPGFTAAVGLDAGLELRAEDVSPVGHLQDLPGEGEVGGEDVADERGTAPRA